MEDLRFGHSKRGVKEKIVIDVKLESTLTTSSCLKIVEDVLKYILYQRHQIPVTFDILSREAAEGDDDPSITAEDTSSQICKRRDIKKIQFHKKRRRWLLKVRKLLESFRIVMETLRAEFEEGEVKAVNLVLGSSVLTSREVYSVILPDDYTRDAQIEPSNGRHSLIQLFRELVTHEGLVKVMSRPIGMQRLWVMVQKSKFAHTSPQPYLGSSSHNTISSSPILIPHPEYAPGIRAQVVHVYIHHSLFPEIPMDLTPSVGAGITHITSTSCQKVGSKRTLGFGLSAVAKHHQPNDIHHDRDLGFDQFCSPLDIRKNMIGTNDRESAFFKKREQIQENLFCQDTSPYLGSHGPEIQTRSILKTPKNSYMRDESAVEETPTVPYIILESNHCATPSKILTAQLGNFTLSDTFLCDSLSCTHEKGTWYQIEHPIYGFKDVCFKT